MKKPLVSVVIPAYKAAHTIGRVLVSILDQTYTNFEVLVIDDGSPDDMKAAVGSYDDERIRLIQKSNGGVASARNLGIDEANGELIAFLDADDYWEPEKLKHQVDLYERFPELGLSCTSYYMKEPEEPTRESVTFPEVQTDTLLTLSGSVAFEFGTKVWTGTIMVPRVLIQQDRFESEYIPAEDRHFWIRMILKAPTYWISKPLATYILEPGSLSRTQFRRDYSNMLKVVHFFSDLLGTEEVQRWERSIYQRWAGTELAEGNPRLAFHPAWENVKRQVFNPRAWWTLLKVSVRSLNAPQLEEPQQTSSTQTVISPIDTIGKQVHAADSAKLPQQTLNAIDSAVSEPVTVGDQ